MSLINSVDSPHSYEQILGSDRLNRLSELMQLLHPPGMRYQPFREFLEQVSKEAFCLKISFISAFDRQFKKLQKTKEG